MGKKLLGKNHGIIKYITKLYLKDLAFSLAFQWPHDLKQIILLP